MLIVSRRANRLFVLQLRAVWFPLFGLLLNHHFVFSHSSPFQKNPAPDARNDVHQRPHPEDVRRPSRGAKIESRTPAADLSD